MKRIESIARNTGLNPDDIQSYGPYMAKIPLSYIDEKKICKSSLILVTAISPTKAGIGKTTVSIGLSMGLNHIGKKAAVVLREPSLGPCFGIKGGATGGGMSQIIPMEKINLHFTGDLHAITSANNMISALLENYIYQRRGTLSGLKKVVWRRVLDISDRSLRSVLTGLGGISNGTPSETSFDITPASEIMAVLCLARDPEDLRRRIDNIHLGYKFDGTPFTIKNLGVTGAVCALLNDAILPNLVQTSGTPAIVHGGPFANIAHGCNTVFATKIGMSLSDYVVTEAGFGADLGAEKFFDIKCRTAGLCPKLTIIVASCKGLKMHGGVPLNNINEPNMTGLIFGFKNLDRHIVNIKSFGQTVLVAINRFSSDKPSEIEAIMEHCKEQGVECAVNDSFLKGGKGAAELAKKVIDTIEKKPSEPLRFAYSSDMSPIKKIEAIALNIYKAGSIKFSTKAKKSLKHIQKLGLDHYPVCIAKTQFSFTSDSRIYGSPSGFELTINDVIVNNGSEFLVVIVGDITRMPGLPFSPAAESIDVVNGEITGLF